jgi:drug/metabolite transporter (DMT)-like permease
LNPASKAEAARLQNEISGGTSNTAHRPSLFLLGAALVSILFIWSFNYVVGKIAMRHIDALSLASLRMPLAALLMLPIYFSQEKPTPIRAGDIWTFAYLGFFGSVINMGAYTIGLSQTTSQHAVVIVALGPILVLLLAAILRVEILTTAKVTGMLICCLGILLLESEQGVSVHSPLLMGDLITFASISGFAFYVVLAKKVTARYDPVSMNSYMLFSGAILILPVAIWQVIHLNWGNVGWIGWAGMFYMAGFSAVVSYTVLAWVLRYMEPSRVAAINYIQPIIVILISIPILGEHPTGHLLAGAALVLLGVYLAERAK